MASIRCKKNVYKRPASSCAAPRIAKKPTQQPVLAAESQEEAVDDAHVVADEEAESEGGYEEDEAESEGGQNDDGDEVLGAAPRHALECELPPEISNLDLARPLELTS